mgnify:CR=1 FL=1
MSSAFYGLAKAAISHMVDRQEFWRLPGAVATLCLLMNKSPRARTVLTSNKSLNRIFSWGAGGVDERYLWPGPTHAALPG